MSGQKESAGSLCNGTIVKSTRLHAVANRRRLANALTTMGVHTYAREAIALVVLPRVERSDVRKRDEFTLPRI